MTRGTTRLLVTGLTLLIVGGTVACAAAGQSTPPSAPSARAVATLAPASSPVLTPKSGGKVTVYSALSQETNQAIVTAFEKAQPVISIEVLSLAAAGDLEANIRAEGRSPRADVFLGGSSEYHDLLGKAGLLDAYLPPGAAGIDPALKDPDERWTGWYLGIFGVLVNSELWEREMGNTARPATWDDLLDPALAGRIVMPDPVTTGGGYIFLASQLFRFGRDEAKAMSYLKRLHPSIAQYTRTSPISIDLVGRGEYTAGLNWGHDVLAAAAAGRPVQFLAPRDTAFEIGAVSIVKGGPNTTGARSFVDWILSQEAAQLIVRLSNRISVHKRVDAAPGAPTLDTVSLVNYDRTWATDNRDRILKVWQTTVGR